MIEAIGEGPFYRTRFTNGTEAAFSDTTADKGGGGAGFRPHELLEAALASCMNMSLRMFAEKHAIPLSSVSTRVTLVRSEADEACFEYAVDLPGDLSEADRQALLEEVLTCPVRRTLSKRLTFKVEG